MDLVKFRWRSRLIFSFNNVLLHDEDIGILIRPLLFTFSYKDILFVLAYKARLLLAPRTNLGTWKSQTWLREQNRAVSKELRSTNAVIVLLRGLRNNLATHVSSWSGRLGHFLRTLRGLIGVLESSKVKLAFIVTFLIAWCHNLTLLFIGAGII